MISKNTLYFYMMTNEYFNDYHKLDEFQEDSLRGHGIMIADINDLLIAIPLRSSIPSFNQNASHLFPYCTYINKNGKECLKALDFSKITIIQERYINTRSNYQFKDPNEKKYYLDNFNRIQLRVRNYVGKYQKICNEIQLGNKISKNSMKAYRFSTLRNFHKELGIEISKDDVKRIIDQLF